MNILILSWKDIKNPKSGGAESVIYNYAKRLSKKGHNIFWYAPYFKGSSNEEVIDGIKIIRKFPLLLLFILTPFWFKKYINDNNIDVVIDEAGGIPLLTPLYYKKKNIIFFIHHIGDKELDFSSFFPLNKIFKFFYKRIIYLYSSYKTITVSNSTKEDLLNYGFKKEKIFVIENGIDLTPISYIPKKDKAFCFVGRIMPIKRIEDAIKAFYFFFKKINNKDYKLYIVGPIQDKNYYKNIKNLIRKLGLESNIIFTGFLSKSDRDAIIKKSIASLITSYKEGFGLNVLESNSLGTAVIAYNVLGLKDSVKDGLNGILVEDSNYKEMSLVMYKLATNPKFLEDIVSSGLNYIKNYESWDKKTDKLEKILSETLDK